jgi:UDPglucose 6-dehydrogenase
MDLMVIGTGHVGLVAGLCFAEIGHHVICVDTDADKIGKLRRGQLPFFEPHLAELLQRNAAEGRLQFDSDLNSGNCRPLVHFLCVGTPPLSNGDSDLSALDRVALGIARCSTGSKLVVEKSTVPVGTGQRIEQCLRLYGDSETSFEVASNPEFLAEGSAVLDFLVPDRIVLGVENDAAAETLREIYRPIVEQSFEWQLSCPRPPNSRVPLIVTNRTSSELIKHASNSVLATKISYINAVADLCERVGADVEKVAEGMGRDHRIGPDFLRAGIGFGGFCFPKDLQAFVRIAEEKGCDFRLLREVERINQNRVESFVKKTRDSLWILQNKKLAVWGLSFKSQTDDIRFSPALAIVKRLIEEGAQIHAYDPAAMEAAKREAPTAYYFDSPLQAAHGADAVLLLTDWPEFREVDLARLRGALSRPLILDGRNLMNPSEVREAGFEYIGIGRPHVGSQAAQTGAVATHDLVRAPLSRFQPLDRAG